MSLNGVLEIDKNIVYEVSYYSTFRVKEDFFNDLAEDYPPYIAKMEGEVHIYPESIVVIPIENGVVDTQDQPVKLFIIPAVCILDIKPLYYRKEKTK